MSVSIYNNSADKKGTIKMATTKEEFSNNRMPLMGLGTGKLMAKADVEYSLDKALELGYRHIDTAAGYQNEELIGKVLKKWLDSGKVRRKDLYIVTKLPLIGMHPERVESFMKTSLKNLQLDFVDLYLIHWPVGLHYVDEKTFAPKRDGKLWMDESTNLEAIWEEIEGLVFSGYTKAVGVSNFNIGQMTRIVKASRVLPSVLQVEMNIYFQQKKLTEYCNEQGIQLCAYAPLGSYGRIQYNNPQIKIPMVLHDEIINQIGKKYGKTPAQISLKYMIQKGIAVIPKSSNGHRLKENFQIFDFELCLEDIDLLSNLDKGDAARSFFLPEE